MPDNPFSDDTIVDDTPRDATLDDLVGEGRKYKTPDELAKAYNNADAFIEAQKAESARKDAELKVLRDIVEARKTANATPDDAPKPNSEPKPADSAPALKVEDLSELVRQEMASANETKRKADNINKAADVLSRVYGSPAKAQEAIRTKAEELGVGFDWLRNLASDSPEAMLRAMDVDPARRATSSVGYAPERSVDGQPSNLRNYKHYNDLRKTDPKRYNSAEVRKQMFEDAQKLGDKFYL